MPSAKDVFGCTQSYVMTMSLTTLQIGAHITHLRAGLKCGNQTGQDLYCMLGGEDAQISVLNLFNSCCCHMK